MIFGGVGETLTIRHDSLARESFAAGIVLAVRNVRGRRVRTGPGFRAVRGGAGVKVAVIGATGVVGETILACSTSATSPSI